MGFVKTRFACLTAISVALLGFMETSNGQDMFTADNFSGTIELNQPMTSPIGNIFSLNYVGTDRFDQTQVNKLGNALQVYQNFIHDGGSVSLTLFTPFGNIPFSSSNPAPGSSPPTLVVWNEKAVGFDFDIKDRELVEI